MHWYIVFIIENESGSRRDMYRLDYFDDGVHLCKLRDINGIKERESILLNEVQSNSFGEFIQTKISPALLFPCVQDYQNGEYHIFLRNCQHFANEIFASIEKEVFFSK